MLRFQGLQVQWFHLCWNCCFQLSDCYYRHCCYYCYFQRIKKLEFQESMNQMLIDRLQFLVISDSTNYIKIKEFVDEL